MYRVMLCKDGKSENITDLVGELSWNESLETVGVTLSFIVPDTVERYIPRLKIEAGDIIQLFNDDGELIRAVVVSVSRDFPRRNIKALDFGFYLNKNDTVIQFKDKSVSECLKQLFSKVGVSVGSICDMPAKVKGVYIKNVNEIIKELIKIQEDNDGKKYYYELRADKIYVFQLTNEPISYIFKPATNVGSFDVTDKNAHSRGKYTHSIEDMKNSIIAEINSKESGKMPEKMFIARDETNIKKYGLLSENYSVNSDEADNIQEVANKRLKEKNTVKRELSMDFIGHVAPHKMVRSAKPTFAEGKSAEYLARPSRVMHIEDDYLGLNDNFRIKSVSHRISGCNHTMSCSLERL